MADYLFNLLTDAMFSIDAGAAPIDLTLPGVLARLGRGEPTEFRALQPHQQHAWHAFLVQLGALAFSASHSDAVARPESDWCAMLLALSGGAAEPWCLIVDDLAKPAFMQPPVPERSLKGWSEILVPDAIDILVTARNHDVKSARIVAPAPEHWVYALVTVQTMAGFDGRMNYGIARMNGGYGNRACVAAARDLGFARRFQRDLNVLTSARSSMIESYGYRPDGGAALLWTLDWSGDASDRLSLENCDPFFIEVTRRIRLIHGATGSSTAMQKGSATARINSADRKGDLGDPWVPVSRENPAALTAKNLSYRTLCKILFSNDYNENAARQLRADDGDSPVLLAELFARGQGKTEGFHQRTIPVPQKVRRFFSDSTRGEQLAALARDFLQLADDAGKKLLKPAVLALLQGGPDQIDFKDDRASPQLKDFDAAIDQIFFPRLFDLADRPADEAQAAWRAELIEIARRILTDSYDSVPIPVARRYRAIAMAERRLSIAARKFAPEAFVKEESSDGPATA
jgi:CRISPR system Cascade subunit CasA